MKRKKVFLTILCILIYSTILEYARSSSPIVISFLAKLICFHTITFISYIKTRPGEKLTESSTGSDYSTGYWSVSVGNFPTAWSVGDVLRTEVTNTANGETGSIELTMTNEGGDAAPDLHLESVVPVELSSFEAIAKQGQVILTWTTESETNNMGFEILKKQQNTDFVKIGLVPGHGTSTVHHKYSYVDDELTSGIFKTDRCRWVFSPFGDQIGRYESPIGLWTTAKLPQSIQFRNDDSLPGRSTKPNKCRISYLQFIWTIGSHLS